jgi:Tfp pilus assembly protein PilZ
MMGDSGDILRLKLRLVAKGDWTKYYDAGANHTIFCPTATPPAVGTPVQIEVMFQGGPRMLLHGMTMWRRPAGDARARAGAGIGVQPIDREKLEYIGRYARDEVMEDKRGRRRLPIRLRVTYSVPGGRRINFTRDLHEHGIFVRAADPLAPGEETKLLLIPPGGAFKPIEVRGNVVRVVKEDPDRGMGIQLLFRDDNEKRMFADFVKRLEQEYMAGSLPDEALS